MLLNLLERKVSEGDHPCFIPMHIIKGYTAAYTVHERLDYAMNPAKTRGGKLVSFYGCDKATAAAEILLCQKEDEDATGRKLNHKKDVLLYRIRQSFAPGESTPEDAQRIGYKLAMRWTKGRYQFIVATHIDRGHIHNHIIYNAVSEGHDRKYRNFLGSTFAVRWASDRLCLENNLSIVENPKPTGKSYGEWLGDKKPPSGQEKVRALVERIAGTEWEMPVVLGHILAGIGASLGFSMNFEAVTARYVDVRLERKQEVLEAYHAAVHPTLKQAGPGPDRAKPVQKKKSHEMER